MVFSSAASAAASRAPPEPSSAAPPAAIVVRSSANRRQMETRLRLRRHLLRIQSDPDASRSDSDEAAPDPRPVAKEPTRPLKGKPLVPPSGLPHHQPKGGAGQRRAPAKKVATSAFRRGSTGRENGVVTHHTKTEDSDGGDSGNDDGDGDEDAEDDEDGDDEDDDAGDDEAASSSSAKPRGDKCELSAVVKLLFSRSDPRGRVPTVWFDYPPHLQVTREPPAVSTGCETRLVVVNASDCALFYKTHWERNCVKNAFAVAGMARTKKRYSGWNVAWAKHMSRDKFKILREFQAFSHFPDPWVIGRKDRLMKTLTSCKRRFGASYAFFPEGFTVPDHLDAFKRATSGAPTSLWILKPPAAACGKGIRVVAARDVDAFLTNEKHRERKYVAQKYLANPLLVDGFKFDLRIYVLVTSVDPLRIYMFQEGLTRFCTTPYSLTNTKNRFAHLTNYSVNKNNKSFVENASAESDNTGNKWSMTALLDHLEAQGVVKDIAALRQQIKDVVCKTVIAAEAHLTPLMHQFVKGFRTQNTKCFELFGFDLMLDDTCTPWLIEANVSPSLMAGSPLDRKVKGLLLSDIFHLVGVPVARDKLPLGMIPDALQPTAEARTPGQSSRLGGVNKQLHEIVHDAKRPVFEKKDLELFTAGDWAMIHDMEDEMERLGHFERIFPCETAQETSRYSPFFTCPRYSNALCVKWTETKHRARAKAAMAVTSSGAASRRGAATKTGRSNSFGGTATRSAVTRTNTTDVATPTSRREATR